MTTIVTQGGWRRGSQMWERKQIINVNNPFLPRVDIASSTHIKVSIILIFSGFSVLFMCCWVSAAALLHRCVLKRTRRSFFPFGRRCKRHAKSVLLSFLARWDLCKQKQQQTTLKQMNSVDQSLALKVEMRFLWLYSLNFIYLFF